MDSSSTPTVSRRHATAVSLYGEGVLILGESGVGKTDLALRLMDSGATLIGDDQCVLRVENERVWVEPVPSLAGVIELRGVGLIRVPYTDLAPVRLVVQCSHSLLSDRLPAHAKWLHDGVAIDEITLNPLYTSAPSLIAFYLRALQSGQRLPEDWMADSHHMRNV
jgi:HPr kinase/phosphorylase